MEASEVLLKERRKQQMDEILRETQVFSRRAKLPEDRIALAEIERELIEVRKRWTDEGRIEAQDALPLNGKEEPAHA